MDAKNFYGVVYCATNLMNKKRYIGQTIVGLKRRRWRHEGDAFRNSPYPLHRSIRKYGKDKFEWEILVRCGNKECLNQLEKFYIRYFDSTNSKKGYNLAKGGNSCSGYKREPLPDRVKKQISEKLKGRPSPRRGMSNINSRKEIICLENCMVFKGFEDAATFCGCGISMKAKTSGGYHWEFYDKSKFYKDNPYYGKKAVHWINKVLCLETLEIFNSIVDASKITGYGTTRISNSCNHHKFSNRGLNFQFFSHELFNYLENKSIDERMKFVYNLSKRYGSTPYINTLSNKFYRSIKEVASDLKLPLYFLRQKINDETIFKGIKKYMKESIKIV